MIKKRSARSRKSQSIECLLCFLVLVSSVQGLSVGSSSSLPAIVGDSALRQVEDLAEKVALTNDSLKRQSRKKNGGVVGLGGEVYSKEADKFDDSQPASKYQKQVWSALATLERDMQMLDNVAGSESQLSSTELSLLSLSVAAAASGPVVFGHPVSGFLAPAMAAFAAAIGIGAEYTGRVAVADGKEVAAASIQCAAEAEGFLANAERAKAISPLCVGIGATGATFALLVPALLESWKIQMTEFYLFCPLVSVLAAAVASLALQDVRQFSQSAISVGNRRFAKSGLVGRTWLSSTELVELKSSRGRAKWQTFCWSVLPAPILGTLVPGPMGTKTIVIAALAAAESAYFLAQAEGTLARATDAVALKTRSAAVCDTYANQGARSAAILPFTSALASLCAAATAAVVELPFVKTLSSAGTVVGLTSEVAAVSAFPVLASLFAAAASVSKARCKVDAAAATQAASTLALEYSDGGDDPILRPFQGVLELIRLTFNSSVVQPVKRFFRRWIKRSSQEV